MSFTGGSQASLVAQMVKNLPAIWETWVQSLGWEDPREKGTATQFREFYGLYSPWGVKESDSTEQLSLSLSESQKFQSYFPIMEMP